MQDFTFFKVKLSLKVLKTYQVVNEESIITFFSLPRVDDFQTRENLITFLRNLPPQICIYIYISILYYQREQEIIVQTIFKNINIEIYCTV